MEVQKRLHGGLETEIETVALRCRHQDRDLVEIKSSAIKSLDLGMEITTLDSGGPRKHVLGLRGVHTGATWRIPLNRPCAASMRPVFKLIYPLVCNTVVHHDNNTVAFLR